MLPRRIGTAARCRDRIRSCPGSARRFGCVLALVCTVLLAAGCSGGGGGPRHGGPPAAEPAPGSPNPVDLAFRPTALGVPAAPDGRNWRTPEYRGHWGLDAIAAGLEYEEETGDRAASAHLRMSF